MLEFSTAGESHGKGLLVIIDGLPAGIEIDPGLVNSKLARRQGGYGRGGRMKIERDQVEVLSGIRSGQTLGSPVGLLIHNRDWQNWQGVMAPFAQGLAAETIEIKQDGRIKQVQPRVSRPRPGHADLAGAIKYNTHDIRNILERASARETAARTAVGGITDQLLRYFQVEIISHLVQLGEVTAPTEPVSFQQLKERVTESPLNCYDQVKEEEMVALIDRVRADGDSLGGVIELVTTPLPVGLGSYSQWDRRLDGRLAAALLSIPAIKGVEIGPAFANAGKKGSEVHDQIYYKQEQGYYRLTNRAGGIEGGISNGEPLLIRVAMKPIPTLYRPLNSVDIGNKEPVAAGVERSDITAVPAAGVVAEAMVSFILADSLLEKFGGDHLEEILDNYRRYRTRVESF